MVPSATRGGIDAASDPALLIEIPVRSIVVGDRLRQVDPATVENLQVSIKETGWFGSVLVRPLPDDELGPRYGLVVGAHRLAAVKALGRSAIAATVRPLSDDEALQAEIDENLVRRGLTPLERAEMVAQRFQVWARRFPDRINAEGDATKPQRGRPKNSVNMTEFSGGAPATMGFAAETAADVGLSPATIERAWRVVTHLPADLRARLHGTPVAKNEGLLRQLAALGDREEQAKVADVLLRGETKSISDARAIAAGNTPSKPAPTPVDEVVSAIQKIMAKAEPRARDAVYEHLAGTIGKKSAWMIIRKDEAAQVLAAMAGGDQ